MIDLNHKDLRWDPYLFIEPQCFLDFWKEHLKRDERRLLYVLGQGFDPRMCEGIGKIMECAPTHCDVWLIHFDEGEESPSKTLGPHIVKNIEYLKKLLGDKHSLKTKKIQMWSQDDTSPRRTGSLHAGGIFNNLETLSSYTDIAVDISALPRGLYFPLIKSLLQAYDTMSSTPTAPPNIHVVVCEDAELDGNIRDQGIDEHAVALPGFGAGYDVETGSEEPKLWLPLLGKGQAVQLRLIHEKISPEEICPLLPSPAFNPRRSDDIILEYHELLFGTWGLEPGDFMYVSERQPFDVYRQLCEAAHNFSDSMKIIGASRVAMSAQSSKLLSLGTLLACYELHQSLPVSVVHVDTLGYKMENRQENSGVVHSHGKLFSLFLAGEYYHD